MINFKLNYKLISIGIAAAVAIFSISFVYQINSSQQKVEKYLFLWEDEVAKNILSEPNQNFAEKIMAHLVLLEPTIEKNRGIQNTTKVDESCSITQVIAVSLYGLPAGQIQLCYSVKKLVAATLTQPLFLLLTSTAILLSSLFSFLTLSQYRNALLSFVGELSRWNKNPNEIQITEPSHSNEIERELYQLVKLGIDNLKENFKLKSQLQVNEELAKISRQVAHDIRSPLSLLQTFTQTETAMAPEKLNTLKLAVARISGISSDLMDQSKLSLHTKVQASESFPSETDVRTCIQEVVDAFRYEFADILFRLNIDEPLKIPIKESDLKRILTNLINNAREAQRPEEKLKIEIITSHRENLCSILITDNGQGIPENVLTQIGNEGATFGKSNGTGLGIFGAKTQLNSIKGDLKITSAAGQGTQILMIWPVAIP
jgi:signal transduction histidine kinase